MRSAPAAGGAQRGELAWSACWRCAAVHDVLGGLGVALRLLEGGLAEFAAACAVTAAFDAFVASTFAVCSSALASVKIWVDCTESCDMRLTR